MLPSLRTNDTGCANVPEIPTRETTDLHQACSSARSLDDIRAALRENPTATTVQDENGKLPLHHLAENEALYLEEALQNAGDKLDIIGVGGINNAETALEKIKAGAKVLQLVTAIRGEGTAVAGKINRGIAAYLDRQGVSSIQEIVGIDSRK